MIIEPLSHPPSPEDVRDLESLLGACVQAGASIGFVAPLASTEAATFWQKVMGENSAGTRTIVVARETTADATGRTGRVIGTAQLAWETRANGRHRAEVQKVMVLPSHRRRGIAAGLMARLEELARARNVRLLVLDTSEGPSGARAFYETLGYTYVGGIPGYALDPDGAPAKNAIYYKTLG